MFNSKLQCNDYIPCLCKKSDDGHCIFCREIPDTHRASLNAKRIWKVEQERRVSTIERWGKITLKTRHANCYKCLSKGEKLFLLNKTTHIVYEANYTFEEVAWCIGKIIKPCGHRVDKPHFIYECNNSRCKQQEVEVIRK